MAHEVETMAYTNKVPWHGLGFSIDQAEVSGPEGVENMLEAAKLNWNVTTEPLYRVSGEQVSAQALVRVSDNRVLNVVGPSYIPTQNHEAFSFFNEFVEAGDAYIETAGSLRGGRYVWGLANLGQSFKLAGGDEVKGYLLVGSPHEQGRSVIMKFTPVRVVCNNTLSFALAGDSSKTSKAGAATPIARHTHRSAFSPDAISKAKETLGIAREQLDQFKEQATILQKKSVSTQDAIDVLAPIFAPNFIGKMVEESASKKIRQLLDINRFAPGAQPGNAWGLLNAATYYLDHSAGRSQDNRLSSAWFGDGASQKLKVLKVLLDA